MKFTKVFLIQFVVIMVILSLISPSFSQIKQELNPSFPPSVASRTDFTKGGNSPLWPPAHRASGPEGKGGLGEIF